VPQEDPVRADRKSARGERDLHHPLVHADRGGEDARAHIGNVGELEQALHRAVLAVRSVQHREDDVETHAGDRRGRQVAVLRPRAID
jgi:hypothetical protein